MPAIRTILLALLCVGTVAFGQATTQPVKPLTSVYDGQPIKRSRPDAAAQAANAPAGSLDWQRLAVAMIIVIGLILVLRFAMLKLFPGARTGKAGGAVRVLTRTAIAPRQQVMLLQVGRRVVVVGDSAGTLTSLAQIEDPDEVALLIGQIENAEPVTPAATSRFRALFTRQQEEFAAVDPESVDSREPDAIEPPPAEVAQAQQEISSLIDRMRSLTRTIRQ